MSEYTELSFDAKLRKDVPKKVLATLQYMVEARDRARPPASPDPHEPLFATKQWRVMLRSDDANLSYRRSSLRYDDAAEAHILCVQCSLRNDDQEIEKFVDWVMRHVDEPEGKSLGFYRLHLSKWPTPIQMRCPPADSKAMEKAAEETTAPSRSASRSRQDRPGRAGPPTHRPTRALQHMERHRLGSDGTPPSTRIDQ
jgi:hypothetical protein